MEPIIVPPGGGERFERANRTVTVLADLEQLSANVIEFDASFEVPLHDHDDHVDAFYVLEGEVEFLTAGEPVRAAAGTFLAAPPGAAHGFRNVGEGRARMLNVHAPDAGFTAFIRGT